MGNRKEGNSSRREDEATRTLNRLEQQGRCPLVRLMNGSVRTYLWTHHKDRRVPMMVEQVRLYAGPGWTASSRGMTASDQLHALAGVEAIIEIAKQNNFPRSKEEKIPAAEFDSAIDRGNNPPDKVFRRGNVATLVWDNPTEEGDTVFKIELLCVFKEFGAEHFFPLGESVNAKKCFELADEYVFSAYQKMKW